MKLNRKQLFDDKMIFNHDSVIPINALQLIDELIEQERLERINKRLVERVELLEFQLENARREIARLAELVDLTHKSNCYYDISGRTY